MDIAHLFLLVLFALSIGHLVTLKICSVNLDHRTAPVFISGWVTLGLVAAYPFFGHLLGDGLHALEASPHLFLLGVIKGGLMYAMFIVSQTLMKDSLSSRHYVTPLSVGVIAIGNSFLGEALKPGQMLSAFGLCALAAAFFLKGHLSDTSRATKMAYVKLVALSSAISLIDQVLVKSSNWYAALWLSNTVLLVISLWINRKNTDVLKSAFLQKQAALAGFFYVATELVKFYQMVTINPVTVISIVQALTKPVILALSALVWKERTLKEQLIWGIMAFALALPLFF